MHMATVKTAAAVYSLVRVKCAIEKKKKSRARRARDKGVEDGWHTTLVDATTDRIR